MIALRLWTPAGNDLALVRPVRTGGSTHSLREVSIYCCQMLKVLRLPTQPSVQRLPGWVAPLNSTIPKVLANVTHVPRGPAAVRSSYWAVRCVTASPRVFKEIPVHSPVAG